MHHLKAYYTARLAKMQYFCQEKLAFLQIKPLTSRIDASIMIIQLAETREKRRIEMVNVTMLNDAIKRSGKTKAEVAKSIQMDESTFYRKMSRNGSTFTVEQACRITETLGIDADTAQSIFFARTLA